jgi:tetratricopeptide (TPR) repeat protein
MLVRGEHRVDPAALVMLQWPMPLPREVPEARTAPSRLLRVGWFGGGTRPFWGPDAQHEILGRGAYPFQSELYLPKRLLGVPASANGGEAAIVLEVSHAGEYPSRVIVQPAEAYASIGGYEHPGQSDQVVVLPAAEGRPALALFLAWNNLLGPRPVAFALPLQGDVHGQAPPYAASGRLADTSRYYLPLPYDRKIQPSLRLEGSIATVRLSAGREYRFDAARGIPLDPADRGGLDPEVWDARRRSVLHTLYRAQAEAQVGHPDEAAAIAGAAAAEGTGGAPLNALTWYWTAIYHLKAAAPAEALTALDRALALEPDAARMLLLKAETEIRLGRRDAARKTLAAFWATASPEMYRYEWMLLCWLAGDAVPLSAALGEFATQPLHTWGMQIRLAHAVLFGDPRDARAIDPGATLHRDEFDYWIARAWLEGADPDPSKALEAIAHGRKAFRSGIVIPWNALEARARRLADPAWRPSPAEAAAIERERREMENWTYRGTEALVMAIPEGSSGTPRWSGSGPRARRAAASPPARAGGRAPAGAR